MKKTTSRLSLVTGSTCLLAALPLWALAQTPPAAGAPPRIAAPTPEPSEAPAAPEVPSKAEGGYLIGLSFGGQLHATGVTNEVTVEDIARGLKDALAGKGMTAEENKQLQVFGKSVIDGILARRKAANTEFLERNGKEKGVKTTASGLQYQVLIPGNAKAASPKPTDTVTVQYRGKLLDGTEFDSSYSRNQPATFPVNGVIKGWQEALPLMKPGAKWRLVVPPDLGYGMTPRPGIPAGSVLIFDVELLSVAAAKDAPAPAPAAEPTSK
jgi:FKBP-type peptidyl-prolyl cis-trans isomerase FklB